MQDRAFANPKIEFLWDTVVDDLLGDRAPRGRRRAQRADRRDLDARRSPGCSSPSATARTPTCSPACSTPTRTATSSPRPGRRTPTSRACSPAATCRTTPTARRSPPPAPAAWRPSTPSAGSSTTATLALIEHDVRRLGRECGGGRSPVASSVHFARRTGPEPKGSSPHHGRNRQPVHLHLRRDRRRVRQARRRRLLGRVVRAVQGHRPDPRRARRPSSTTRSPSPRSTSTTTPTWRCATT